MSQQTFKRGKVPMRFKPTRGIGSPNLNRSAANARMEAIGEKTTEERVFDIRRHESEIRRAAQRGGEVDALASDLSAASGGRGCRLKETGL